MSEVGGESDGAAPAVRVPGPWPPPRLDAPTRVATITLLLLLLAGFVSLIWTPHPPGAGGVAAQLRGPSFIHILGTDAAGDDLLSLLMRGLLTSYVVAVIGTALGLLVAVPLGLAAAFVGGMTSRLVAAIGRIVAAIPALAAAATLAALFGPGPINAMAAIGIGAAAVFLAVTHDTCRVLLARDHMSAARLAGLSPWDAGLRHAVPTLVPVLVAQTLVVLGFGVIAEAALSFAGLGARPDGASLGLMLREALAYVLFEPRLVIVPGLAVVVVAGALHIAAAGLRRGIAPDLRAMERHDALA